jgi:hypothetical protein
MRKTAILWMALLIQACQPEPAARVEVEGELKQWHKVTLLLEGPQSAEYDLENPFLDYRVEVTFSKEDHRVVVPGYFAADGNAGESGAREGRVWKVHFRPDQVGTWEYRVHFRKAKDLAILDAPFEGEAIGPDGMTGVLEIRESDKTGDDLRAQGRIVNGGKGYFRFQDTETLWIKNGTDSPENFLAYHEFDQTSRFSLKTEVREGEADPKKDLHKYEPHLGDWEQGDPTWKDGLGKGIIGAVNYLHSTGVNSIYMLTMNIQGDGKDVWPYTDHNERYRFDCSKLDQWEVVFDHMESLGMMIHFVLQETENECLLDIGSTGVQRRVYLRELVARFGHHLAVTWNLGEENGPAHWTPIGQTDSHRKEMASYLKTLNPYPNIVVLHTHADDWSQEKFLEPLLGFEHLDGPSMQIGNPERVNARIRHWVDESETAGKRWLVNLDEIGPHWRGVMPDSFDPDHDTVRHHCLWGSLLAGGAGVEWYFGYRYPHTDLTCEDFRSRANWWKKSTIATRFMSEFPLEEMQSKDVLTGQEDAWCLADPGELYLVYLPETGTARLNMDAGQGMEVHWFNPREGGAWLKGSVAQLKGKGPHNLGDPPDNSGTDWVVIVN